MTQVPWERPLSYSTQPHKNITWERMLYSESFSQNWTGVQTEKTKNKFKWKWIAWKTLIKNKFNLKLLNKTHSLNLLPSTVSAKEILHNKYLTYSHSNENETLYKRPPEYSTSTPGDNEMAFKILLCQIDLVILRFFQLQSYILKCCLPRKT